MYITPQLSRRSCNITTNGNLYTSWLKTLHCSTRGLGNWWYNNSTTSSWHIGKPILDCSFIPKSLNFLVQVPRWSSSIKQMHQLNLAWCPHWDQGFLVSLAGSGVITTTIAHIWSWAAGLGSPTCYVTCHSWWHCASLFRINNFTPTSFILTKELIASKENLIVWTIILQMVAASVFRYLLCQSSTHYVVKRLDRTTMAWIDLFIKLPFLYIPVLLVDFW